MTICSHTIHQFNTNVLKIVPHSYQSKKIKNAIKTIEHRQRSLFAPKQMSMEQRMWRVSDYKGIFIQNREVSMFAPFIYILWCLHCFPMAESNRSRLLMYFNTILFIGDALTVLMTRLNNDIFVDLLYAFVSIAFLCLSSNHGY